MYKRRKVFSKIGEKTFSTTEFQTQKEFAAKKESAKKEESKKEKVAKAATIGGATVGLGAGAAGLGADIGRKKVKRAIDKKKQEISEIKGYPNSLKSRKVLTEGQKLKLGALETSKGKLEKAEKILEKVSKKAGKAGIAGVGASIAAGTAYKLARKKKEQKEFAEKKDESGEKAKKAGKAIAGTGAALYAGASVAGAKASLKRAKAVEKIAEKTGTMNIGGNGITSPAKYVKLGEGAQEAANKAAKLDERHAKKVAKVMKRANKVAGIGTGLIAAGAGTYLYGKHKAKKGEDQKKLTDKEFSDGEPEQKEFNSKAQKILRRAFDKSIGKKVSGANTLNNQVIGREALRKLKGSGVNASINEKARVNGASATSDKLSNSADKYARGVKTRSLKDTEVGQKIYDHDHVYKSTPKVIEDAKQIMKKNK